MMKNREIGARFNFNIEMLEKKYRDRPECDVEVDLKTFEIYGTSEKDIEKGFKALLDTSKNFSFAAISAPIANETELQSESHVRKTLKLNEQFSKRFDETAAEKEKTIIVALQDQKGIATIGSPQTPGRSSGTMQLRPTSRRVQRYAEV